LVSGLASVSLLPSCFSQTIQLACGCPRIVDKPKRWIMLHRRQLLQDLFNTAQFLTCPRGRFLERSEVLAQITETLVPAVLSGDVRPHTGV
jgi:hypothetical protein